MLVKNFIVMNTRTKEKNCSMRQMVSISKENPRGFYVSVKSSHLLCSISVNITHSHQICFNSHVKMPLAFAKSFFFDPHLINVYIFHRKCALYFPSAIHYFVWFYCFSPWKKFVSTLTGSLERHFCCSCNCALVSPGTCLLLSQCIEPSNYVMYGLIVLSWLNLCHHNEQLESMHNIQIQCHYTVHGRISVSLHNIWALSLPSLMMLLLSWTSALLWAKIHICRFTHTVDTQMRHSPSMLW